MRRAHPPYPAIQEGSMAINTNKVVVGGLAAGAVMNAVDFVVNGWLLKSTFERELTALNPSLAQGMEKSSTMVGFLVCDFIMGFLLVWTYAAIRPRFGPGAKTSAVAAIMVWLVGTVGFAAPALLGIFSWNMFVTASVVTLINFLISGYVGALVYKEEAEPAYRTQPA
jgi:hypothetical protein